ncbi:hypothetical protein [Kitasatospora sp. CB01950]|uniref:hypothetical protein n=1 Tax=Kitasatospora sp. CB01950 TaxID=1703930 RepID=UPI00093E72D4|nr:hypothetical protein [Kitasatospora sp. CB01950]OKJ13770.1 hypothetical protein AMK19_10150 [Kitasatospora sp. CB01950]
MSTTAHLPATAAATPAAPSPTRRSRLRGLAWLAWRQNRLAVWTFGGAMLAVCLGLFVLHWQFQDVIYRTTGPCASASSWNVPICQNLVGPRGDLMDAYSNLTHRPFFLLPAVVGMFLGAPLLSQEYERGTLRMIRAQSVSPVRWLTARLTVPALLVTLSVGLFAAMNSWLWYDMHRLSFGQDEVFPGFTYASIGLAPLAWSLFALALGVAVGQLLRRTVASVLVTGVLVLGAQVLMPLARVHFLPPVTGTYAVVQGHAQYAVPIEAMRNAWLVNHGPVLADGTRLSGSDCYRHGEECTNSGLAWGSWHPLSHVVPMQLIEGGLLLAVSAALVLLVYRRVTRTAA